MPERIRPAPANPEDHLLIISDWELVTSFAVSDMVDFEMKNKKKRTFKKADGCSERVQCPP